MEDSNDRLLQVRNLKKYFPLRSGVFSRTHGYVRAVDGVSFEIGRRRTLGLVGESGCGKTTLARALVRLWEPTSGEVVFDGVSIRDLNTREMRRIRRNMQIIFQDPFSSLNPRMTVGAIVGEPLAIHGVAKRRERLDIVRGLLEKVGLSGGHVNSYPHEFSGGQRQRICIARAIALSPKLIVCDEPVSALDVSIQSQILNLLRDLQDDYGLSYLFISHDLRVVEHMSDEIAVMYLGRIVEMAGGDAIYENPLHPYTRALFSAVPVPDPSSRRKVIVLGGDVPSPISPPPGCHFHPRCPEKMGVCEQKYPPLKDAGGGHEVACFLY